MNINLQNAVAEFNNHWNPIAQGLDEAEEADAGYDAGEFSSAFHGRIYAAAWGEALNLVAVKFGVSEAELEDAVLHGGEGDDINVG